MGRLWNFFLSLLLFLSALVLGTDGNPQGCVENVGNNVAVDLFPDKVKPSASEFWNIEYHNTYKLLSNKNKNETYLLYQCGTEIPLDLAAKLTDYNAVIEIPLQVVGITQTPMITYLEQIGVRDKIGAFLTDPSFIWSPCFAQDVASGKVALVQDRSNGDGNGLELVGNSPPELTDMVAFVHGWESGAGFSQVIRISEYLEKTNQGIFEWVLFYSAFFNQEALAKQVAEAAEQRFECIQQQTAAYVSDEDQGTSRPRKKLLWGYYWDGCGGWDVGECPNYYCDLAEASSVEILSSTQGSITCYGATYMTTDEFIEFGKDADYWFFNSYQWNTTLAKFEKELSVMKSVQNKQVFDYQGKGKNSWFEQRYAEYYSVLEDMGYTVGTYTPQSLLGRRHFWRNVYTEAVPGDGLDGECTNETAANILSDPHVCGPNTPPLSSLPNGNDDPNSGAMQATCSGNIIMAVAVAASAVLALLFFG